MKKEVGVSLLSADWSNIKNELSRIKNADHIHLDVMDGHFVPNLSFGPHLGMMIKKNSIIPIWSHLMVSNPEQYITDFAKFSKGIIIHQEIKEDKRRILNKIRKKCRAGIAVNPETPIEKIEPYLDLIDIVLVMSVHPGKGGQKFIKKVSSKFKYLRQKQQKHNFKIMVDGGINYKTKKYVDADILVAGSYVMQSKDKRKSIEQLRL